ncbi:imidazole glycerol phosphate synthase subunit HisH [Rhizobium sp. Nf11,1]|uniref:imidazole glycerol phosphate synthase subunit HisH n=1 Tax=Rhizobium sp. Nf11,1 TaxID=3404923 RepID=UPI003D33629A
MPTNEVVVVNYGAGNIRSVARALEHSGAVARITADPDVVATAGRILLPGVGAFPKAMRELPQLGLDDALRQSVAKGNLLLGICLGMQMLFQSSDEFEVTNGLGFIPGNVSLIPSEGDAGVLRKVPHIAWNELVPAAGRNSWGNTLLRRIPSVSPVYFVHSFMANPTSAADRIADGIAANLPVTAVVQRDNVFGCQFHPEKSGVTGLRILEEFLSK